MMPLSGVRISWLMRERNAVFALLAACASCCALRARSSDHARIAMMPRNATATPATNTPLIKSDEPHKSRLGFAVGLRRVDAGGDVVLGIRDALVHDGEKRRGVLAHPCGEPDGTRELGSLVCRKVVLRAYDIERHHGNDRSLRAPTRECVEARGRIVAHDDVGVGVSRPQKRFRDDRVRLDEDARKRAAEIVAFVERDER